MMAIWRVAQLKAATFCSSDSRGADGRHSGLITAALQRQPELWPRRAELWQWLRATPVHRGTAHRSTFMDNTAP